MKRPTAPLNAANVIAARKVYFRRRTAIDRDVAMQRMS